MNPFRQPLNRRRHYTVAPRTWVPGELVTAGMMNGIRDNLNEVGAGGVSIPGMLAGDMIIAASGTQLGRVPPNWDMFPRYSSGLGWNMAFPTAGPHDLWVPANGMHPHPSSPCGYHVVQTYGYGTFTTLPFVTGAWNQAAFSCMLPRSWNLAGYNVQFAWLNSSGAAGNVHWMLYSAVIPNWAMINWTPAGAASTVIGVPAGAWYLQITAPVLMPYSSAVSANGLHNFLVQRGGASGSDTFTGTGYLIGVLISPVTNKDLDV